MEKITIKNISGNDWQIYIRTIGAFFPEGFIDITNHGECFRTVGLAIGYIKRLARRNGGNACFFVFNDSVTSEECWSVFIGRETEELKNVFFNLGNL